MRRLGDEQRPLRLRRRRLQYRERGKQCAAEQPSDHVRLLFFEIQYAMFRFSTLSSHDTLAYMMIDRTESTSTATHTSAMS